MDISNFQMGELDYRRKNFTEFDDLKDMIRNIPDFPKSGTVFKDIFPLLQNCFGEVIDDLSRKIQRPQEIDYILGVESRGFIFAAALAYKLNKGFIPIRKKGKLPPPTISEKVAMEYGETELEMAQISKETLDRMERQEADRRVLIVDDVLATGETMRAAFKLCMMSGFLPVQGLVLVRIANNIPREKVTSLFNESITSLFDYKD